MNENIIFFPISRSICGKHFEGSVAIDTITGDVDLCGLCDDTGLFYRDNGRDVLSVINHLKALAIRRLYESNPEAYSNLLSLWCIDAKLQMTCLKSDCVELNNGSLILRANAFEYEGVYYYDNEHFTVDVKIDENTIETLELPHSVLTHCFVCCECCHCYIKKSDYDFDNYTCKWCKQYAGTIENYGRSHDHNSDPLFFDVTKNNKVFGSHGVEGFAGLGFELEVQNYKRKINHNKTAYDLIDACGFEDNELRYAYDGSVNAGFEIISEPHTIKAFYTQKQKFINMLNYLASLGYTSHKSGDCGLHIHISRRFFGKTRDIQDTAIAKIMTFYDENWDNIVKISRREYFGYCSKNEKRTTYNNKGYIDDNFHSWKKNAKRHNGCHGDALNNSNTSTFEFRLGRGTLNPLSFFAWIDFTLTIARNSKRLTIEKIKSNDIISWLGGISESTARYIYNRGAFQSSMLYLFPSIAWENNIDDNF